MLYKVIDIDSGMNYKDGDEVMGIVEADSTYDAIDKVLMSIGVNVLKPYDPDQYALHILKNVDAVPLQ